MPLRPDQPSDPMINSTAGSARALRRRSTGNLLRMGHCAPTVMQTLLDGSDTNAPWLVKLTAGLPGGIGNTGGECGGVTAPLFHRARAVFLHLDHAIPVDQQVLAAASAFMGGTIFAGMTCSALTARVMALGLAVGKVENSRPRVLRMIATMAVGGDAFADKINAFNRTMSLGHRLSQWFAAEFGSTQCRAITRCDFSSLDDVSRYVDGGGTARCVALAERVAQRVQDMVASAQAAEDSPQPQAYGAAG